MRVLVATCVHRRDDARVFQRQIRALLAAGHEVIYAAPDVGSLPQLPALTYVPVERARGRRRLKAWRSARRVLCAHRSAVDVIIVHNLELLPLLPRSGRAPAIWDVHEDSVATIADKAWIPGVLKPLARRAARALERRATKNVSLILAEDAYADHLGQHLVVPNTTPVPATMNLDRDGAIVYVGRLSKGRGLATIIEVGRVFGAARVELVGDVDPDARTLLAQAVADGWVTWHGYLPNDAALQRLSTATYGLSLLHDLPNYRHSKPTKLHEYFAQGAVAISTPLPLAKGLIEHSGSGLVVPYGDAAAVVDAIRRLDEQPDVRRDMASTGYQYARRHLDWNVDARAFVAEVERVAASGRSQHGAPESGDSPS